MSYEYNTINGEFENTNIIERSKFICYLKGVQDETEAKEYIDVIKKRHSLANHSCYAYIADEKGLIQKFSDAGEPQGTAGLPMLEVLKNKRIFKTVAVVVRYFGGIKLGTGGLTRAYGGAVSDCLGCSKIAKMCSANVLLVVTDYEGYSRLLKVVTDKEDVRVLSTEFDNAVSVKVAVKSDQVNNFKSKLLDVFNGKINIQDQEQGYYDFG
jgi:uncharacterized YigZ family protein